MTLLDDVKEYIICSEDTNQVCERSLLCAALIALEEDPPNLNEAKRRLHQIVDQNSKFVDPPHKMLKDLGINH